MIKITFILPNDTKFETLIDCGLGYLYQKLVQDARNNPKGSATFYNEDNKSATNIPLRYLNDCLWFATEE